MPGNRIRLLTLDGGGVRGRPSLRSSSSSWTVRPLPRDVVLARVCETTHTSCTSQEMRKEADEKDAGV